MVGRMERLTEKFKDGRNILRKGITDIFHVGFGRFFEGEAVEKLAEYEDLEGKSRLLKLPCAVGDTVYVVMTYSGCVEEIVITGFSVVSNVIFMMCDGETGYREDLFGKTIFLTRQEAEDKLSEMEGKK